MEEEAYFLWSVYSNEELPYIIENSNEVRSHELHLKRCVLQKVESPIERHKRVAIDFDPLGKKMCFVVIIFYESMFEGILTRDQVLFSSIFDNQKDAQEEKNSIDRGGFKNFLKTKEKFCRSEIITSLVTDD